VIHEEIIAKRYADAILSYTKRTIGFENGLDELQRTKHIIQENPNLKGFFVNPEISDFEKNGVVDAVFRDDFAEETRHLLKLLIAKRRISLFMDIAEYARVHYAHGAEIDTLVKTSYLLETETLQRIKNALEARVKRKIHMYVQLDADMCGGVYARIGNIIIDGSIKKRLEDMRDKLDNLKVV
jgi:F-type H+-transporting ATPase subunit delta